MKISDFFENVRYAVTGKPRDRTKDRVRLTRDMRFQTALTPREKHAYKSPEYFQNRWCMRLDIPAIAGRRIGKVGAQAVSRIYLRFIAGGYIGFSDRPTLPACLLKKCRKLSPRCSTGWRTAIQSTGKSIMPVNIVTFSMQSKIITMYSAD